MWSITSNLEHCHVGRNPSSHSRWPREIITSDRASSGKKRRATDQPLKGTCGRSRRRRVLLFDMYVSSRALINMCLFMFSQAVCSETSVTSTDGLGGSTYTGRGGNHQREPSGQSGWPQSHQPVKYVNIEWAGTDATMCWPWSLPWRSVLDLEIC
jgi:hypothetical protein